MSLATSCAGWVALLAFASPLALAFDRTTDDQGIGKPVAAPNRGADRGGRDAAPARPQSNPAQSAPRPSTPPSRGTEGPIRSQPVAPPSQPPAARPISPAPATPPPAVQAPVAPRPIRESPRVRADDTPRVPQTPAPSATTQPIRPAPRPAPGPVEQRGHEGRDGTVRVPEFHAAPRVEPGRPASPGSPSPTSRSTPTRADLPPIRERRHVEQPPTISAPPSTSDVSLRRGASEGVVSIPEHSTRSSTQFTKAPLQRLDRHTTPSSVAHTDHFPTPRAPFPSTHLRTSFDVDVRFWWGDPCNRFVSWRGWGGCECGYVFCGPSFYWYWWRPGCDPFFTPYCYYWTPASYCLPAYYPSYAYVRYVDDYVTEEPYYPTLSTASAPAKSADAATLVADGWTSFHAAAYPEAVEFFRQAVLAKPDDAPAKIAYAQALFAVGDYADAAFLIRRTVELLPDWPATGEDPRTRYADAADHAEEMLALRSFLDRVPGDPAATLVLAVQSYFTGDLTVARESFVRLAALDPEDRVVKLFLERLGPAPAPKK